MKIEYLEIKNYKQFTDLTLDLTYPKGHEKEGKPLDKICIIGQSGTGKTNLLEIIVSLLEDPFISENTSIFAKCKMKNNKTIEITLKSPLDGTIDIDKQKHEKLYYINVSKKENNAVWEHLNRKIENYDSERLHYVNKLSYKLLDIESYEKKNFQRDIKDWESKNNNILEQIADKINEVLIQLNLQLTKIDKNQRSYTSLTFKDLSNSEIIKYQNISTGTKNLLSTFIPLKSYNPRDSMILIDEPENSFYPDIQRQLTDLYLNIGENNQLIMATHSPLIASSFEPWEVVELKFDKNNQIYREKYYEGKEDHVNNYTRDPRMLTWTGILTDIFDLEEDSNFIFREKKLMEYAMLKNKIKTISDTEEKEKLFKELRKIGKQLGLYNQ